MDISTYAVMHESSWSGIIEASGFLSEDDSCSRFNAYLTGNPCPVEVRLEPGMGNDRVSIIVIIDGLQYRWTVPMIWFECDRVGRRALQYLTGISGLASRHCSYSIHNLDLRAHLLHESVTELFELQRSEGNFS